MKHLDDLRASLFEFQNIGYLTDMKIVTFEGSVAAHRAIIFGYLPEEVKKVFCTESLHDELTVLLPDVKLDTVKNAITKAYLDADASALVQEVFQSEFRNYNPAINHESKDTVSNGISLDDMNDMEDIDDDCESRSVKLESDTCTIKKLEVLNQRMDGDCDLVQPLGFDTIKKELIKVEVDVVSEDDLNKDDDNFVSDVETSSSNPAHKDPQYSSKDHECIFCHKMFSEHGLKSHLPRKHGTEGSRHLKMLGLVGRNKGIKRERKISECPICFKQLNTNYMGIHMTIHNGGGSATCDICGKQVFNKDALKNHIMAIHTKVKPHKCADCNYESVTREQLTRHIKNHHNTEPKLPCSKCGKLLAHKEALKRHEKIVHMEIKTFQCPECQMLFKRKFDLKSHLENIHSNETFMCDMCDKTFPSRGYLEFHRKSHEEDKAYKCDQCPKSFVTKQKLREHIYKHTGEKPYICPFCSSAFNSSSALAHHKRGCQLKSP